MLACLYEGAIPVSNNLDISKNLLKVNYRACVNWNYCVCSLLEWKVILIPYNTGYGKLYHKTTSITFQSDELPVSDMRYGNSSSSDRLSCSEVV